MEIFTAKKSLAIVVSFAIFAVSSCKEEEEKTASITYDLGASIDGIHNFASIKSGSSEDLTLTLTNSGKGPASSLSMTLEAVAQNADNTEPFTFKGGTYPGTGGTCTDSLGNGENCTVIVSFTPVTAAYSSADYSGAIGITFNDGKNDQSKRFNLNGSASLCSAGSETNISNTNINVGSAETTAVPSFWFAQSFTLTEDKDIKNVVLSQYNGQNAQVNAVTVGIYPDASGKPGATAIESLSSSPSIQASSRSWFTYTMPRPVMAKAGTPYWVVVKYDITSPDPLPDGTYYTHIDKISSDYAGGIYQYTSDSGNSWSQGQADLAFKVETCK